MFKVRRRGKEEIVQVLDTTCDDFGKAYFLIWENDGWRWRPADNFVPPNYRKDIKENEN